MKMPTNKELGIKPTAADHKKAEKLIREAVEVGKEIRPAAERGAA